MRAGRSFSRTLQLLMLVALLLSLLALGPNALAQGASTPGGECQIITGQNYCIDKTASPAEATVGQPLIFTITMSTNSCPPNIIRFCGFTDTVTDTLPDGVTFVSAFAQNTSPEQGGRQPTCTNSGNTVTCAPMESTFLNGPPHPFPSTATIIVTPTQCGTLTNTVTSDYGISASADFTVVGCTSPPPPVANKDSYNIPDGDRSVTVPASSGVLANDTDAQEGDTLTVRLVRGPKVGKLKLREDGSFVYKMPKRTYERNEFNGVAFVYEVSDGARNTDRAKVTINKG